MPATLTVFINDNTLATGTATNIPSALSVKTYVDNAVDGVFDYQGAWDASAGTFPGGGTALKGHVYKVSVAGTVDGVEFNVNDSIYAEVTNASTTTYASNWNRIEGVVEFDASLINLTAGYAAAAGTVTIGDSVEVAIEKLDGNIQGLVTTNVGEGTNLYFTDARSIASPLTGFTSGAGTLAATDSILQGIQELDGNIGALVLDSLGDVTQQQLRLLQMTCCNSTEQIGFRYSVYTEQSSRSLKALGSQQPPMMPP